MGPLCPVSLLNRRFQGPSVFWSLPNFTPFHKCVVLHHVQILFCFCNRQLVDIMLFHFLGLMNLAATVVHVFCCCCKHLFSVLLGLYLGMNLQGHTAAKDLTFKGARNGSLQWRHHVALLLAAWGPVSPPPCHHLQFPFVLYLKLQPSW